MGSRIDRLLFLRGLRAFLIIVGMALLLVLSLHALLNYNQLTRGELPEGSSRLWLILKYYLFLIPTFLAPILTIATVAATLLCCAPMLKKREFVALTATGLSLRRTTVALLLLAIANGATAIAVRDQIEPRLEGERAALSDLLTGRVRTGRIWQIPETGAVWYAQNVHLQDRQAPYLRRVAVALPDGSMSYAEYLRWRDDGWHFEERIISIMPDQSRELATSKVCTGAWDLHRGPESLRQLLVSRYAMTGTELMAEGDPISRAFVYKRLSAGLAPLLAVMLALSLFVRHENGNRLITASIQAMALGCLPLVILGLGERIMDTSRLGPELASLATACLAALPSTWRYWRWHL